MKLLLAPHSDDETLFASFVQLEHRPKVVVCLQGRRARHLPRNATREAESRASAEVLGTDVVFIESPCDPPDWRTVENFVRSLGAGAEHIFAPLPEVDGASQHNAIGNLAVGLFGADRVTFYATYTLHSGRTQTGARIEERDGWPALKQQALACFRSQSGKPDTAMHFYRDQGEYLSPAGDALARREVEVKLNLGAGSNAIFGFHNLDATYDPPWRFEDGLRMYPDETIDAVTVSHALMYVDIAKWPFVFSEIARVLKPGGVVRVTEDNIGGDGSTRREIRPGASVATNPELLLAQLSDLNGERVTANVSYWHDRSLIQSNYGDEPDVFHVEGVK